MSHLYLAAYHLAGWLAGSSLPDAPAPDACSCMLQYGYTPLLAATEYRGKKRAAVVARLLYMEADVYATHGDKVGSSRAWLVLCVRQ